MSNPDADDLREVVRECWAAAQNCCASKGEDSAPSCCDASPERACCSESADPAQETELREGAQGTSGLDPDGIRQLVRERYAGASTGGSPCCADRAEPSCCAANADVCCPEQGSSSVEATSARLGYSPEELAAVPEGANMGLGCGNPQAIAAL